MGGGVEWDSTIGFSKQMEDWLRGYSSVSQWNLISDYVPPASAYKRITCGNMNNENEIILLTCY